MGIKNIKILLTTYLILLLSFCECQENKCALKETCGMCIRDSECVWCNEPFVENSKLQRCEYLSKSKNPKWCAPENIINPESNGTIIQNLPLESSIIAGKEAIQISPQRVKLILRPGQEYELKFKYATAKDYPVDLYYIMDLSASMDKHKQKLSQLGNLLSTTMKKLTKSFRLGFGSFVDKVAMPYTSTYPKLIKNPCKNRTCISPYSFKNHLPLTDNSTRFTEEVTAAYLSGNLDFSEGSLDALMQAIVCQKEIGWRRKARHLIVLSSDADYHIAGDGKLAGIVLPNDGECHMKNNEYTHGTILDYPSIAHIAHKVKEHNINLIFAIVERQQGKVKEMYEILERKIEGSSLGSLTDNSNVVELVKDVYDKIVDSVKISDNSASNIEVKYFSSCRTNEEKETNECKNLQVGVEVDFKAVIKVLNCPENHQSTKQTFEIKPGALNESLIVEVETICNCDCERKDLQKAPECYNSGTLQCGVCSCDPGKFGTNCECDGQTTSSSTEDVSNCRISNTSDICSGLGTCKCNKCDCQTRVNTDERIYGKFCECTNYSCEKKGGYICSNNGQCDCGICKCFAGFVGEFCECRLSTDTCIGNNGDICSGHGNCSCDGSCTCDEEHLGKFCQKSRKGQLQVCEELKDCVECTVHKAGVFDTEEKCFANCGGLNITEIEKIEDEINKKERICRYVDEQGCNFYYKYYYDETDDTNLMIFAQKEKICTAALNILALIAGIIGTILLAGLILLLLWKGVTTVHDRREYAKFDDERKNAKWNRGENPLFKNPTSTFRNPTYNTMEY